MTRQRQKKDRNNTLVEAASHLGRATNLEELIDWLLSAVCRQFRCKACSISTVDEATGDLLLRSSEPDLRDGPPIRIPRGKGIAGRVFATGEPDNTADAGADPEHYTKVQERARSGTRAMMTVPLMDGNRRLGVAQALNPIGRGRRKFRPKELEIFEAFAGLAGVTLCRIEHQRQEIRNAELRRELRIAAELVEGILPPKAGVFAGIGYRAFVLQANTVGGDFFIAEETASGIRFFALGDVCGHGIPAAIDMARVSTVIHGRLPELDRMGLAPWTSSLNDVLQGMVQQCRFTAAIFLAIGPKTVELVIAGHRPPLLWLRPDGTTLGLIPQNPPLGVRSSTTWSALSVPRKTFHTCLMMSDGIFERRNTSGQFFEDFAWPLPSRDRTPTVEDFEAFLDVFQDFAAGGALQDDATALWISVEPSDPAG
ncbi:MAG TPA: SpoIIE family protein phosphatase [Verrucomicrobiae bacterium]|nr:SpoIIE family protein phosphatase [Verrucomicrobiae bacterium]